MSDKEPEFFLPPRAKPKPGSLPLNPRPKKPEEPCWDGIAPATRVAYEQRLAEYEARMADPDFRATMEAITEAAQSKLPPWGEPSERLKPKKPDTTNLKKLKAARKKVAEYSAVLRTDAFDDWVRRCTDTASQPREWTQAETLYESYLRHAKKYGANRPDKRLANVTLASMTAWGKMMGSLFDKKRRRAGQYYPLRLKQGA
ncbi:hypothetical protein [Sphingobium sp. Ant17]|uniref:hypothetical protein n=1 Tax=Sphingobium sp. Ant17 TaxID=1461752 RepID=UPI0004451C68|nr:hypothetical protein [Sphingobium sp. Ant17]EXS70299.1 hypothetical protein BF95_26040 [Sphingobium sp. Ant17]